MLFNQSNTNLCALIFSAFLVSSCGGGGGETPSNNETLTGRVVDAPVENLRYETASKSGRTNSQGEFEYIQGETVSFYIGDILLGTAIAAATINPFDLAGISIPSTKSEIYKMYRQLKGTPLSSMHTVINIASILQTLDDDGDPTNGILIPELVHTIATGMQMNFDVAAFNNESVHEYEPGLPRIKTFRSSFELRMILAQGTASGLWGGRRHVVQADIALANLYSGLGITAVIDQEDEFYYGGMTNPSYINYSTYDAFGNRTLSESDFNANGDINSVVIYDYDANNNLTLELQGTSIAGPFGSRTTQTYDDYSNQTSYVRDVGDDNNFEYVIESRFNDYGRLSYRRTDRDGDGVAEEIIVYNWDAIGFENSREIDRNDDGAPEQIIHYQYDERGNETVTEDDTDANGTIDIITTHSNQYDANGNLTITQSDTGNDGSIDSIVRREYNSRNYLTLYEIDDNNDGMPERITRYEYNSDGYLTLKQHDNDGDGILELNIQNEYDNNNNLIIKSRDFSGDGIYTDIRYYSGFDADGNATVENMDDNGDGNIDLYSTYTYVDGFITNYSYAVTQNSSTPFEYIYIPTETAVPWREVLSLLSELN